MKSILKLKKNMNLKKMIKKQLNKRKKKKKKKEKEYWLMQIQMKRLRLMIKKKQKVFNIKIVKKIMNLI